MSWTLEKRVRDLPHSQRELDEALGEFKEGGVRSADDVNRAEAALDAAGQLLQGWAIAQPKGDYQVTVESGPGRRLVVTLTEAGGRP